MSISKNLKNFIKNPNKIIFSTISSIIFTLLFAIYNGYLGLRYSDSWGVSIFIYYLCLIFARLLVISIEIKNKQSSDLSNIRKKIYIGMSIFMFFIDLCLFAPITLMIIYPKDFVYGLIPSIVVAVYTTYKITMAIVNYNKTKKIDNLSYKFLRELSVVDALVSILTLQHTLIMANGGMTQDMMILSSITSLAILSTIIIFSILSMINSIKKQPKAEL